MEVNKVLVIVVVLFVLLTLIEVLLSKLKKNRLNKLMHLLMEQNFEEFDALLEKNSTKFFVPIYNSIIFKVNKSLILRDSKSVEELMSEASKIKMNDDQALYLYSKVFSYYLSLKDVKKCEEYYQEIMKCKDCPTKEYVVMVYDTLIKKGYQYIEKAEKMLENATDADKENLQSLIAAMYANKG